MTREEAIRVMVGRFRVAARITDYDYDPAGSSYTCVPDPHDLEICEALVGRKLTEDDFYFTPGAGPYGRDYYTLRGEVVKEIQGRGTTDGQAQPE